MKEWLARWWLDVIMGGIVAALGVGYRWLSKRLKRDDSEMEALKTGLKALLRDRLVQTYYHHTEKGHWPIYARDSALEMYKQYTALGGNGTVSHLVDVLKELPTDKRKEDAP